jgi:hypothetical protein
VEFSNFLSLTFYFSVLFQTSAVTMVILYVQYRSTLRVQCLVFGLTVSKYRERAGEGGGPRGACMGDG